jgi:hypothetical protein
VVRTPIGRKVHIARTTFKSCDAPAFSGELDCDGYESSKLHNASLGQPLCATSPLAGLGAFGETGLGDAGVGGLFGSDIGDSFGVGGLGMSGTGAGGGGTGEGIGLGTVGGFGKGGGSGTGSGYGPGGGASKEAKDAGKADASP